MSKQARNNLWLLPLDKAEGSTPRERERNAVREWLRGYLGDEVRIEYLETGRPVLTGTEQRISIAHTTGWAAIMLDDDSRCGVDIELVGRDAKRQAGRIAAEAEMELAGKAFPLNPELWIWCVKEAAFKAAADRREINFRTEIVLEKGGLVRVDHKHVTIDFLVTEGVLVVWAK